MSFIIICVGICILTATGLMVLKAIDWFDKRKKFETSKSEFVSDLFAIQMKWSRKGYIEYASAIGLIIEGFNLPPEAAPNTEYGKDVLAKLKKIEEEDEL